MKFMPLLTKLSEKLAETGCSGEELLGLGQTPESEAIPPPFQQPHKDNLN